MIYKDDLNVEPLINAGRLRGNEISDTTPSNNDVLQYQTATKLWTPTQLPAAVKDFILIETKTITAPQTEIIFSNLNGDTDKLYFMQGIIVMNATGQKFFAILPNDITTNQQSIANRTIYGGVVWLLANMLVFTTSYTTRYIAFNMFIFPQTGKYRQIISHSIKDQIGYAPTYPFIENWGGVWYDTTTNITSLVIRGYTPTDPLINGIGANTVISLYKVRQ